MSVEKIMQVKELCHVYRQRLGFFRGKDVDILKGLSFDLYSGETLGVLGRNGCGKSTLLRILGDIIGATSGEVIYKEGIKKSLMTLGLGFKKDLSGRDNVLISAMLLGLSKKEALASLKEIEEFSELGEYFNRPVKTYSTGMRARLGFASAILNNVDLLLIDEALGVGDVQFKKKAEKVMMDKIASDRSVIFVSHSMAQIKKICNRVIWLEKGEIMGEGDPFDVTQAYEAYMKNEKNQP